MAHLLSISPTYRLGIVNFSIESSAGTNMRYNVKSTITGRAVFSDGTTTPIALASLTTTSGSISGNVFTPPYLEIGASTTVTIAASCKFADKTMQSSMLINIIRPRMNMTWTVGTQYQGSPGIAYSPISLSINTGNPGSRVEYELLTGGGAVISPKTQAGIIDPSGNMTYNHTAPSAAGKLVIKTYIDGELEREESFIVPPLIVGVPDSGSMGDTSILYFNNCPAGVAIYYTQAGPAGPTTRTALGATTDMFGAAQVPVNVGIYPGGTWTATFYANNTTTKMGTNAFTRVPKITSPTRGIDVGDTIELIGHNLPKNANVQYTLAIFDANTGAVVQPAPGSPAPTTPATALGEWSHSIVTTKGGNHEIDIYINGALYGHLQVAVAAEVVPPTFTVSSNVVTEGESVIITGYNIPYGSQVLVQYMWNGGPETPLNTPSPANSNGVWTYTVYASPAGTYVFKAYMNTAANPGAWNYVPGATTTIQVNPAAPPAPPASPTFSISATEIFVGETVTITGNNIPGGSTVKMTYSWNGGPETVLVSSPQVSTGTLTYSQAVAPAGSYFLRAYINDVYVSGAATTLLVKPV